MLTILIKTSVEFKFNQRSDEFESSGRISKISHSPRTSPPVSVSFWISWASNPIDFDVSCCRGDKSFSLKSFGAAIATTRSVTKTTTANIEAILSFLFKDQKSEWFVNNFWLVRESLLGSNVWGAKSLSQVKMKERRQRRESSDCQQNAEKIARFDSKMLSFHWLVSDPRDSRLHSPEDERLTLLDDVTLWMDFCWFDFSLWRDDLCSEKDMRNC